jgi:hypothetical protein
MFGGEFPLATENLGDDARRVEDINQIFLFQAFAFISSSNASIAVAGFKE